jgi:CheY-like chemotaxis protein
VRSAKTVFVVEDDEDLAELIKEVIEYEGLQTRDGYQAVVAFDSLQALQMIGNVHPDLFLLDYYLPRMNGLDLYDRLHALPGLEHIPAIFLSANPPRQEIEKRKLVGIKKPFSIHELFHTIDDILTTS